MAEHRLQILQMLKDKKISVEDAERLIRAIPAEAEDTGSVSDEAGRNARLESARDMLANFEGVDLDDFPDLEDFPDLDDFPNLDDLHDTINEVGRTAGAIGHIGVNIAGSPPDAPIPPIPPRIPRPRPTPGPRPEFRAARHKAKRKRGFGPGWDIRTSELTEALALFGIDHVNEHSLEELRVHHVTPDMIRALHAAGLRDLRVRDLVECAIHEIDAQFAAAVVQAWPDIRVRDLREFSIHGLDAAYIAALREQFPNLQPREAVEFGIHGLGPGYVAQIKAAFPDLSTRELVELGIHGLEPDFVAAIHEYYPDIRVRDIREFGIHGISAEYVRDMREHFPDLRAKDIIQFGIHGLEADYARTIHEQFPDLRIKELVQLGIHDMTAEDIRYLRTELAARGYDNPRLKDLIAMHVSDFDPAYIDEMRSAGFTDIPLRTLIRLWGQDVTAQMVAQWNEAAGTEVTPEMMLRLRRRERRDTGALLQDLINDLRDMGFRHIDSRLVIDLIGLGVTMDDIRAAREANPQITLREIVRQFRSVRAEMDDDDVPSMDSDADRDLDAED
ncbi:MAG: hypothetical protein JXA10_01565 [Anaerolineae bacterium]|nr:hypothetical protein [Anaerolineae bacterium]